MSFVHFILKRLALIFTSSLPHQYLDFKVPGSKENNSIHILVDNWSSNKSIEIPLKTCHTSNICIQDDGRIWSVGIHQVPSSSFESISDILKHIYQSALLFVSTSRYWRLPKRYCLLETAVVCIRFTPFYSFIATFLCKVYTIPAKNVFLPLYYFSPPKRRLLG